jgi:hypothetical protein
VAPVNLVDCCSIERLHIRAPEDNIRNVFISRPANDAHDAARLVANLDAEPSCEISKTLLVKGQAIGTAAQRATGLVVRNLEMVKRLSIHE